MRVYISVDMEGVAGVVHRDQTGREGKDYEQARKLMTNEANAAIQGALEAGARDIVVNDSHGTMRNIDPELLRKEAKLISGSPKRLGMMEGIDSRFQAAIFIGYHTRSGSEGILNHTYNGRVVSKVKINNQEFGEFGINALIAGEYGVPAVFVSGCNLLVEEAKKHIQNIHSAQVKHTINRVTTESLHPDMACELIKNGVIQALQHNEIVKPYKLTNRNYDFELYFTNTLLADVAETLPLVQRKDPLCISYRVDNIIEGYLILRSLIMMANNYV